MQEYKLESRKKINNINEIYDGKKLLIKEFVNLDLSNLDLSVVPMKEWENCIFYNTSFKNTGIKFIPNNLAKASKLQISKFNLPSTYNFGKAMSYCDFSDNDFSYLTKKDFYVNYLNEISTNGCDFSNTGINFLKTLIDVKLDLSYQNYDYNDEYWSFEEGTINWPDFIDINTILKNPYIKVPSFRIVNAISKYLGDENRKNLELLNDFTYNDNIKLTEYPKLLEYVQSMVNKCEEYLEYDKQGYAKKLY